MTKGLESVKASSGERMIELDVRFWTCHMCEEGKGFIMPKHGWTRGSVAMRGNESHGISPQNPRIFNSLMELPKAVERVLIDHDIKLHCGDRMTKYIR